MTIPRILDLIDRCTRCTHKRGDECQLAGVRIPPDERESIPAFCPLRAYPSKELADLAHTRKVQQEPNKYGLRWAIMSHLSVKLKANLDANTTSVQIRYKDGTEEKFVTLDPDYILEISRDFEITFMFRTDKYALRVEGSTPNLRQFVNIEGKELSTDHCVIL